MRAITVTSETYDVVDDGMGGSTTELIETDTDTIEFGTDMTIADLAHDIVNSDAFIGGIIENPYDMSWLTEPYQDSATGYYSRSAIDVCELDVVERAQLAVLIGV